MLFSSVKNFLISFVIALASFGVVAFLVVAIVINSIGGAFVVDPFGNSNPDTTEEPAETLPSPGLNTSIEGESLFMLVVITDYRPEFYGDYDYNHIKTHVGISGSIATPPDLRPDNSLKSELPQKPAYGTLDSSFDGSPNIIGGLTQNTYRRIHNDVTLLVRIDKERKQFTFTSFPANTLVNYGNEKLLMRDVYYYFGLDGVINTVQAMTGILPDRHVLIHSEYVDDLVNEIEGLDAYLSTDMICVDKQNGLNFNFNAGQMNFDGEAVKQMLLYDGYSQESGMTVEHFGMNMVRAFISKLTQPGGYSTAGENFLKVQKYFITDLTVNDIVDNKDLWYGYSTFSKIELNLVGQELTDGGILIYKVNADRTIEAFIPYRKALQNNKVK